MFSLLIFAGPLARAAAAPAPDNAAALLAITPRTNLPPAAEDPLRPKNTRQLKPDRWTDDVGIDDNGYIYNLYWRASTGVWSNYDETKANPFPLLPDPLVLKNGQSVKDADTWWKQRRPEILSDFLTEVYGTIPGNTPKITWEVTAVNEHGGVRTKTIVGHIDNSAYPDATPTINLTLSVPANASGPVPVMVIVSPSSAAPPDWTPAPVAVAPWPRVFYTGRTRPDAPPRGIAAPGPMQQILARGWGCCFFDTISLQADSPSGMTRGIVGLMNQGRPRSSPDAWGTLTAWTWGLSRSIDYLETDPDVDAKHLGVEGHSRWGKTALWAAALDQRWVIVYASCSGEGGAKLLRRNYGETTDKIAGSHWMADSFRKYGGHWNDLPVDTNELIALVAPRPAFITGATQDPNSDSHGEFLAAVGAGPVYRLLGKKDLGTTEMPEPDVALVSGEVAFREHVGAHSDIPDWPIFLEFASKYFRAPVAKN